MTQIRLSAAQFLDFSRQRGNDLVTPRPEFSFPGLKVSALHSPLFCGPALLNLRRPSQPGDRWALCASRWVEAAKAGVAPPLILEATHASMLRHAPLDVLQAHAIIQGGETESGSAS